MEAHLLRALRRLADAGDWRAAEALPRYFLCRGLGAQAAAASAEVDRGAVAASAAADSDADAFDGGRREACAAQRRHLVRSLLPSLPPAIARLALDCGAGDGVRVATGVDAAAARTLASAGAGDWALLGGHGGDARAALVGWSSAGGGGDDEERALPPSPPPPPPPSREPSSWKFSQTTRSFERFWPVCLSSHESSCKRPSMKTGRPFFKYSPATSACRPHMVTSTKVTSSRFSPPSAV
jgi:hypothetical protein